MPGFDGTGPMGGGPMTGRGMGYCSGARPAAGAGFGYGRGGRFGFGFGRGGRGGGFGRGRGWAMGWAAAPYGAAYAPPNAGMNPSAMSDAELAEMAAGLRAQLEQLEAALAQRRQGGSSE